MILMGDRVPMYKMRAHRGLLWAAALIFVVGGLLAAYFYGEDTYSSSSTRGLFTLIVTSVLSLFLIIAATAHFWFAHLWHHRPGYKRG
ncbi:MAG: hypothetical protein JEZ10_01105 [Verrucomicrobia bacterium]|nr:hypothetical protein [Verrucomicrobiota bacterium]